MLGCSLCKRGFLFKILLFLGLPITPLFSKILDTANPNTIKFFISENEDSYLKEVTFEQNRYIGKFLGETVTIFELHLLEKNIYSILNKMIPDYPFDLTSLVVFAIPSNNF
jgi:hypothetical protein